MESQIEDLCMEQLEMVAGGDGFWSAVLSAITSVISTQPVSQPALNADLGIRG